jgi:hypothetical protein
MGTWPRQIEQICPAKRVGQWHPYIEFGLPAIALAWVGGEGGIRTHGRGNPDTRSPGVPDRPLQHLSAERVGFEPTLRINRRPLFESGTINHSVTSPEAIFWDTASYNAVLVNDCFGKPHFQSSHYTVAIPVYQSSPQELFGDRVPRGNTYQESPL